MYWLFENVVHEQKERGKIFRENVFIGPKKKSRKYSRHFGFGGLRLL